MHLPQYIILSIYLITTRFVSIFFIHFNPQDIGSYPLYVSDVILAFALRANSLLISTVFHCY